MQIKLSAVSIYFVLEQDISSALFQSSQLASEYQLGHPRVWCLSKYANSHGKIALKHQSFFIKNTLVKKFIVLDFMLFIVEDGA